MGFAFCYLKNDDTDIHLYIAHRNRANNKRITIDSSSALCKKYGTRVHNIYSLEKYCETEQEAKNHIAKMDIELCADCAGWFHSD